MYRMFCAPGPPPLLPLLPPLLLPLLLLPLLLPPLQPLLLPLPPLQPLLSGLYHWFILLDLNLVNRSLFLRL
jgi:hypothetical protein